VIKTWSGRGSAAVATESDPTSSAPLVALVGPPNSGKSTLFNQLTGLHQKVANYPGVTVEKRFGTVSIPGHGQLDLVDLPGVNGLSPRTLDEKVTRDVLQGRLPGLRPPDGLIMIVDSTRLETQLMMVEPVLELGLPTLLVLNMADELEKRGGSLRADVIGAELGAEVARTNAKAGLGLDAVHEFLASVAAQGPRPPRSGSVERGTSARAEKAVALPVVDAFAARRQRIRAAASKAEFVPPGPSTLSRRLDGVVLHRVWGPLIFLAVVALVFQAIFTWAVPFMDGVDFLITTSGEWLGATLPNSWYRSLLVDGIWSGVGSVVIFLPQILILFLFLGLLEDSGYMARAAVIADRMMERVGLQGRAFLPLLSGYACAVPAILAARTVENERDRLATIFVTPFMTCSARLPVYALLIAAFIPEQPVLGPLMGTRAATLLGLYALGALAAVFTAFLLKRTLLRSHRTTFVMELPSYRVPTLRSIGIRLLDRSRVFLRRVGRIIMTVAIVLWVLTQVPMVDGEAPPIQDSALGTAGQLIEPVIEPLGFDWRVGIGLISSLAAREVIVGTLGTIYGVEDADEGSMELQSALQRDLDLGAAVGLLIFFAFALQCMSTVAVMRRETASWRWPILQFGYMLFLAYLGAFAANALI